MSATAWTTGKAINYATVEQAYAAIEAINSLGLEMMAVSFPNICPDGTYDVVTYVPELEKNFQ